MAEQNQIQRDYLKTKAKFQAIELLTKWDDEKSIERYENAYETFLEAQDLLIEWGKKQLDTLLKNSPEAQNLLSRFDRLDMVTQERISDMLAITTN